MTNEWAKPASKWGARDYELVAAAIRDARATFVSPRRPVAEKLLDTVFSHMATFFANKFREDSPRFDVERFLKATFPPERIVYDNDTTFD